MSKITAEFMWVQHRSVLGGKSAMSGDELPATLAECKPGVQEAHYGLAVAAARLYGDEDPAPPPGIMEEAAARVRMRVAIASTAG